MDGFLEHFTFGIFVLAGVAALYEFVFGVKKAIDDQEKDD